LKDGLENIDKIIKQAFDGFESNVDPSVWNNIQNSIASGNAGANSSPQANPTVATGVAGKSLALKIVAGVVLLGSVASTAYFVSTANNEKVIAENIVVEDNPTIIEEPLIIEEKNQNERIVEHTDIEKEKNSVDYELTVETNKVERKASTSLVEENNDKISTIENNTGNKEAINSETKLNDNNKTPLKENTFQSKKPITLHVSISTNVSSGIAPLSVQFDAKGNGIQYFWEFDDDTEDSNEESPLHVFRKEGTYNIKLTSIDKSGNSKTAFKTIVVEKNVTSSLGTIPNVITPNGDGRNDVIKISGENIEKVEVVIMDKTGKVIYIIKSLEDVWDGKDQNGDYLLSGTYYMSGVVIGKDDKKHVVKQALNLMR
jgi:gliding motility-associated-like protein